MADLTLHTVQWCAQHGHPVLALRTADDRYCIVAISIADAVALAFRPGQTGEEHPVRRLHALVETAVTALGARLTEVRLYLGDDHLLRASLQAFGPTGQLTLPAHFADGIALAQRGCLPLRMSDSDLDRVPLTPIVTADPGVGRATPPEAFRALIEELDLGGFDSHRGDPDAGAPHRHLP
jgi:bifunctional DNase/RNase